jgi:hypothetical protein
MTIRIKVGNVKEFTHAGVTGVWTEVLVGDETWTFACFKPNCLIDEMDDLMQERYWYKSGRWDGDWRVQDPKHIEIMQRVLMTAHEKLLPYVKALRANDHGSIVLL